MSRSKVILSESYCEDTHTHTHTHSSLRLLYAATKVAFSSVKTGYPAVVRQNFIVVSDGDVSGSGRVILAAVPCTVTGTC